MIAKHRLHKLLLFPAVLIFSAARIDAQVRESRITVVPEIPLAMMVPLTTTSAPAREQFLLGLRASDVGQGTEARKYFLAAVGADASFALAYLYTAFNANSTLEYRTNLEKAISLASKASLAERLMIQIAQRGRANDPTGQLELAQQLVTATPSNPRSLMRLAGIQSNLGNPAAARITLEKAIKAAPRFAPAFIELGNSYLTIEPRNVAKGAVYIRQALDIEPDAPYTHDFMGDAYRANNELAKARSEYTRQAELDPTHAIAFQQRGHVNSFLGNYAEARADYDKSVSLGDDNEKASYPVYSALVNVYAGDAKAAERELEALVTAIDGTDIQGKVGAKIFALTTALSIALHNGHIDVAQRTADQLGKLWREDADVGGTPEYRRAQEANIIWVDGMIAARKGDYAAARAKAQEYMKLVEPDKDPRKYEGGHEMLGMADLLEKKYTSAAAHLAQADPNNTYIAYQRAVALDGAGKTAEARVLFKRVASTNFNSPDVALTKKDAARRLK